MPPLPRPAPPRPPRAPFRRLRHVKAVLLGVSGFMQPDPGMKAEEVDSEPLSDAELEVPQHMEVCVGCK